MQNFESLSWTLKFQWETVLQHAIAAHQSRLTTLKIEEVVWGQRFFGGGAIRLGVWVRRMQRPLAGDHNDAKRVPRAQKCRWLAMHAHASDALHAQHDVMMCELKFHENFSS